MVHLTVSWCVATFWTDLFSTPLKSPLCKQLQILQTGSPFPLYPVTDTLSLPSQQLSLLKQWGTVFLRNLVSIYQATRRHNPKEGNHPVWCLPPASDRPCLSRVRASGSKTSRNGRKELLTAVLFASNIRKFQKSQFLDCLCASLFLCLLHKLILKELPRFVIPVVFCELELECIYCLTQPSGR